jgi:ABC-type transport system substrate-binding protein
MTIKKSGLKVMLLILAMTIGLLAACSGKSDSAAALQQADGAPVRTADSGLLRVGINAECSNLGPWSAGSNGRNSIILTLYQTLGDLDGVGGPLVNIVMKDYKKVDAMTYNIEIWDTVYDTAGNHIDASDVVWSHQQAIKAATNTNTRYIKSIEQTGDYTIRLVLTADFVGVFENVVKIVCIVSRKAWEASPDEMATTPIGTTQYKLTSFVPGASAAFEKTNNYWQKDPVGLESQKMYGKANVDKITYTTIREAAQMAIALETGTIDLGLSMDSIEAKRFMAGGNSSTGFTVFEQITNIGNQMYLSGDPGSPFHSNQALRQAVLYAIDKQGIVDAVLEGYGVVEYTFGGDSFSDFNPSWKNEDYYNYNPGKAKQLLTQSGYQGNSLRIMTDNTAQRNRVAQIIQGYLLQVGINSTILQYDSALFNSYKSKPSEWEIMLDNTGSSDYLVTVWRSKFDARQYSIGTTNGWQDPQLQRLLVTALSTDGHTQKNMDAFHEYFKEQAYGMGLFNYTFFSVAVNGIKNIMYDAKMFVYAPGTTF